MEQPTPSARIGNVLYPADDVAGAVRFYAAALGLGTKFVDGDRYAALDAGGVTLAITGGDESLDEGPIASFKVDDVRTAVDSAVAHGAVTIRQPEQGPHEVRAVLRDPWRNKFVIYGKR